jgi:nucleotide-binding universal stress UspA family protein
MKILIATDGSKDADLAARTALRLLNPADRNVDVLCVAPAYEKGPHRLRYQRRILAKAERILERTRDRISADVAEVQGMAVVGSAAAIIVDHAEDYDLTVIGAKDRSAGGDTGLGPVARRVVEHALAPVLIGREVRSESGMRVLAAVDGSCASQAAITTLSELFDLASAEITLMHVEETPWIHLGLQDEWQTYDEDEQERSDEGVLEKEMTREAEVIVQQARSLLRPSRASVSTMIDQGNPADEILSEAERGSYDLLVLGATGERDLKHSMLGSVSSKIAWNAPCSVLLVREPPS